MEENRGRVGECTRRIHSRNPTALEIRNQKLKRLSSRRKASLREALCKKARERTEQRVGTKHIGRLEIYVFECCNELGEHRARVARRTLASKQTDKSEKIDWQWTAAEIDRE